MSNVISKSRTSASGALTYDEIEKGTDGEFIENLWKNRCGQGPLNAFVGHFIFL